MYIVVEKFFTQDELDPCRDAVNDSVEELAQRLYQTKRIKSKTNLKSYSLYRKKRCDRQQSKRTNKLTTTEYSDIIFLPNSFYSLCQSISIYCHNLKNKLYDV